MQIKIEGLKDLEKNIKQMERNARKINGTKKVPQNELFPNSFMRKYTQFSSIDAFFNASGFNINNQSDFNKIPDAEWDRYVSGHTKFKNWNEMKGKAAAEWGASKIGLK